MFGVIFGSLCLAVTIAMFVRRHRWHAWGHGACGHAAYLGESFHDRLHFHHLRHHGHHHHGHHHHGWGAHGHHGWSAGRGGSRGVLRGLFTRLDTTPGQEKAILTALDGLRERVHSARQELLGAGKELAAAFGGELLDQAALEALFARKVALGQAVGEELRAFIAVVHEALDPEQRRRLAELIEDGSLFDVLGGGRRFGY
jgi:Spy/CpxP family protein refolding chaperone